LKITKSTVTFAAEQIGNSDIFHPFLLEIQFFMKYRLDKQEQYAVLTLEEENLNSTFAPALKSDLILFNQEGVRNFILDLSQVKYVDSSGLSAILTGHRLWKDNGSFVIAGQIQPMVNKLIEISRLQTILTMIPTVSESIDYVLMEELERELQGGEE
jgi:anti-anti-sigma factor